MQQLTGTIFGLVNDQLVEMNEALYFSEDVLQSYLEKHVKLLAGEQINPSSPRRWLLLAREMSVPDIVDGKERWSLDHLFVDQDAIPTLVEVKRSTNTEIRRRIIGQLLDYAANGSQYWTLGRIREAFVNTCNKSGEDEASTLREFLEISDSDDFIERSEAFWTLLGQNLHEGRIRLLLVADVIPPELRRVIEFLNKQMTPAQVFGLEVRQYKGPSMTAFVPRIFPQTMEAEDKAVQGAKAISGPDVVPTLINAHVIPEGATLQFDPAWGARSEVEDWMKKTDPAMLRAEWRLDISKTLQWKYDEGLYSTTGLAKEIYARAGYPQPTVRGPKCWKYNDKSLVELFNELNSNSKL